MSQLARDSGDLIDGESDSEDSPTFNPDGAAALEAESRSWGAPCESEMIRVLNNRNEWIVDDCGGKKKNQADILDN